MAKVNPFRLPRPESIDETRTFTDPLQPGVELTIRLRSNADYSDVLKVQSIATETMKRYGARDSVRIIVGKGDGREAVEITSHLCIVVATILVLQQPIDKDFYNFEELVAFTKIMPNAFAAIVDWGQQLIGRVSSGDLKDDNGKVQLPNDCAARTEGSSVPPRSTKRRTTRKSSTETTPSSSESTA